MHRGGWRLNNWDVRFGSKADICTAMGHVRFTPESGHVGAARDVRFGAISETSSDLFDDLVCAGDERWR
jgi:hypothetical protein